MIFHHPWRHVSPFCNKQIDSLKIIFPAELRKRSKQQTKFDDFWLIYWLFHTYKFVNQQNFSQHVILSKYKIIWKAMYIFDEIGRKIIWEDQMKNDLTSDKICNLMKLWVKLNVNKRYVHVSKHSNHVIYSKTVLKFSTKLKFSQTWSHISRTTRYSGRWFKLWDKETHSMKILIRNTATNRNPSNRQGYLDRVDKHNGSSFRGDFF